MCRLAFITKRFKGFHEWLAMLEASQGGHGNGVAVGRESLKGVDVTVDATVDFIRSCNRNVLWHTRRISSGHKCDELCHPFPCDGGWLVHNGHWSEGDDIADTIRILKPDDGAMSDTKLFALLVDKLGFERAVKRYEPSGVWLHMTHKGKLRVWKNWGSLHYSPDLNAYGSEPAEHGYWFEVADGFYRPGEVPKCKNTSPVTYGADLFKDDELGPSKRLPMESKLPEHYRAGTSNDRLAGLFNPYVVRRG